MYLIVIICNLCPFFSTGDYHAACDTLATAISLISQSRVGKDERCQLILASLRDTLQGLESKLNHGSGGGHRKERPRSRERSRERSSRREKSSRRERTRSREREYRERSRERERHYDDRYRKEERDRDRHSDRDRRTRH